MALPCNSACSTSARRETVDADWLRSIRTGDAVAMVNSAAGVRYPAIVDEVTESLVCIIGHTFSRDTGASMIAFLAAEWRLESATAADLAEIEADRLSADYDGRHDVLCAPSQ